ncbi:DUF6069 family protein [Actinoplanes sp. NPDC051633]|uniref:DUF6069 family protein n=1 Tax=Actinoplanes sp. NPDC051633 TaxID=3155670 RepID=UPI00341FDC34
MSIPRNGPPSAGGPQSDAFASASGPIVDARRLWAGGGASALVAALVAIVGVLISRGLFETEVVGVRSGVPVTFLGFAVGAAVVALAATGLVHLLLRSTPRPLVFFGWIVGLTTVIGGLWPFLTDESLAVQVATSLVTLAVGICIGSLVSRVAAVSVRGRPGHAADVWS